MMKNPEQNRGEEIKQDTIIIGNLRLHYILFESRLPGEERYSYDIAVTAMSDDGSETVRAHDISSIRTSAAAIFEKVRTCEVTPCTLLDVLEEIL